jgi:hypothetical protein
MLILVFHVHHFLQTKPNHGVILDLRTKEEIVRWLKPKLENSRGKFRIMGYGLPNRAAYFLGIHPEDELILPVASIEELILYARQEKVDYIIIESHEVGWLFESYFQLFNPKYSHPELKREYLWVLQGHESFVIYSVIPEGEAGK